MRRIVSCCFGLLLIFAGGISEAVAGTLEAVRARGHLLCGIDFPSPGFSFVREDGEAAGFQVDICRAIASAALGSSKKVRFINVDTSSRFQALASRQIDVLVYTTTWNMPREGNLNVLFPAVYLYDGQGFMVSRKSGISSLQDIRGRKVCVFDHTTSIENLRELDRQKNLDLRFVPFVNRDVLTRAFLSGECEVFSSDIVTLYAHRAEMTPRLEDYIILPTVISKEPLGPTVRDDDIQWFKIVRWVINALIDAEEKDIRKSNVDSVRDAGNEKMKILLGAKPGMGDPLGLDDQWVYRIIREVGNYGEIFERNIGMDSPLKIDRGLNRPWTRGGVLYAAPLQ